MRAKSDPSLDLLIGLGDVIDAIGDSRFYETLASTIARFLDSERFLVIRYAKYAKPLFLVNCAMTEEAVESYLANYYRIDPLLRMVRDGVSRQVVTFDELRSDGTDTYFYDEMFRTANIRDEMVFLLPTLAGVRTAICIDRSQRCFSKSDISKSKLIFPTLQHLHTRHVDQCLFGWLGGFLSDSQIALMIVDQDNTPRFRNENWTTIIDNSQEEKVLKMSVLKPRGSDSLNNQMICHWEPLDMQNAVAPGGKAIVIEEISPGYVDLSSNDLVGRFARTYELTPRELEIVEQILKGQPAVRIAKSLNVSVGTIRNHKHRLYNKLDITTERELFCMVFNLI